jgi:hypothetical protein
MESEGSLPCCEDPATLIPILSQINPIHTFDLFIFLRQ